MFIHMKDKVFRSISGLKWYVNNKHKSRSFSHLYSSLTLEKYICMVDFCNGDKSERVCIHSTRSNALNPWLYISFTITNKSECVGLSFCLIIRSILQIPCSDNNLENPYACSIFFVCKLTGFPFSITRGIYISQNRETTGVNSLFLFSITMKKRVLLLNCSIHRRSADCASTVK